MVKLWKNGLKNSASPKKYLSLNNTITVTPNTEFAKNTFQFIWWSVKKTDRIKYKSPVVGNKILKMKLLKNDSVSKICEKPIS